MMTREEWELHQNFDRALKLIEYVEDRVIRSDWKTGEYLLEALMELGKIIGKNLDEYNTNNEKG